MENVLNAFLEAELPVTEADIAKPSKEFVVNLITVFLNKFHIDGHKIKQGTEEQLKVIISEDRELYEEVIKLINIHVAMAGICDRIFVKDFQLIDITSPSPKKTKKLTEFLANFVLYYKNKLSEIEVSVNEIAERREIIDQSILRKKDALQKIAISKTYRENQLNYNDKLKQEIEEVRKRTQKAINGMEVIKEQVKLIEQERLKVAQVHGEKKAEALKVINMTAEIQAQVVESPEGLKGQLQELERQKDLKIKERELKYDSIKEKKQLLERREYIQAFIQKEAEKLSQVMKVHNEKKERAKELESIIKEQEDMQDVISKLEQNQKIQQNYCSASEIEELNQQMEQRLLPLREQYTKLSKEVKRLETQFAEDQEKQREILSQIDSVTNEIAVLETETSRFLKQCQTIYNKEISEDLEMSKIFESLFQKEFQN